MTKIEAPEGYVIITSGKVRSSDLLYAPCDNSWSHPDSADWECLGNEVKNYYIVCRLAHKINKKNALEPCPCGETPKELHISEGYEYRREVVSGSCCNEWIIEFRVDCAVDSDEIMTLAIAAWNKAKRAK